MNIAETPVLIASCDRYADVWNPFFRIFRNYWPDCPFPVYLGSNFRNCGENGVQTIRVGEDVSWATGVMKMLDRLRPEYLFLFLEDFFLIETVDTRRILELAETARQNQIGCLRLVSASHLSYPPTYAIERYPGLGVIAPGDLNRVSTQVALWKTETLRKLLNPHFNPWQFEEIGTVASEEIPDQFWGTYRPAILYDQCVERGKWRPEGIRHCRKLALDVDLTVRPLLPEEDVHRARATGEKESVCHHLRRSVLLSFKSGKRLQGLKDGIRLVMRKPASVKVWAIVLFGLMGKGPIHWLFRQYSNLRVLEIENKARGTSRNFILALLERVHRTKQP